MVVPTIAMVLLAPFGVLGLWMPLFWVAAVPCWLGTLAIPGYVHAWRAVRERRVVRGAQRIWAYTSIGLGSLGALLGTVFSLSLIVPPVLGLWCFVLAVQLLVAFVRLDP